MSVEGNIQAPPARTIMNDVLVYQSDNKCYVSNPCNLSIVSPLPNQRQSAAPPASVPMSAGGVSESHPSPAGTGHHIQVVGIPTTHDIPDDTVGMNNELVSTNRLFSPDPVFDKIRQVCEKDLPVEPRALAPEKFISHRISEWPDPDVSVLGLNFLTYTLLRRTLDFPTHCKQRFVSQQS